jgi:protoporphyrinogen oxidase
MSIEHTNGNGAAPAPATSSVKILILGGGPTGLGAALRLEDLRHPNWLLLDGAPQIGGLARSYVDDKGFTWDLGGHVIFSHYAYFDDAMDFANSEWNVHQRESWVWCSNAWVPYPFQMNIHRLPNKEKEECLSGLLDTYKEKYETKPQNFEEYFTRQFGKGVARLFMAPYNFKVWAVPPAMMSTEWTGERVATVDVKRVCRNIINNSDDAGWGPNSTFRFPVHGGTGGLWSRLAKKIPHQDRISTGSQFRAVKVDAGAKQVTLSSGEVVKYDYLVSTIPLDDLLRITTGPFDTSEWSNIASQLVFSSTHVVGFGIKGVPPPHLKTMCWMYFPESTSPFYRATVFSNYSKYNAPEGHWSLMLEVSESAHKPVNQPTLIEDCLKGCLASTLLTSADEVVSKWHIRLEKGYPTPFVGRNALLDQVQPTLQRHGIYSRGRFGGWKYEVANQDHSMMQGVEAVEEILGVGKEITYWKPDVVNATKNVDRRLSNLPGPTTK